MKITLSEIKKNLQRTNSEEDEAKNKINNFEHKKEKSIQSEEQEEKKKNLKNEDRISSLWDNFTNNWTIGVAEGEEEEQESEHLFEKK